jgi:hypothetical protein
MILATTKVEDFERASSPTPKSRRSCKRPGTKAYPRPESSAASTTPSGEAFHAR